MWPWQATRRRLKAENALQSSLLELHTFLVVKPYVRTYIWDLQVTPAS